MMQLTANLWNVQNGLSTLSKLKVQAFCQDIRAAFIVDLKSDNKEAIDLIKGSKFFDLAKQWKS